MTVPMCWSDLKTFFITRNIPHKWIETVNNYIVMASNSDFECYSVIKKTDPKNQDQTDFETNFKT